MCKEKISSGIIVISGTEIGPHTSPEMIEQLFKSNIKKKDKDSGTGWLDYFFEKVTVGSEVFNVRIMFSPTKKLSMISLAIYFSEEEAEELSWKNWSEEKEIKRDERHRVFLGKLIGPPPYKYTWGEISHRYDQRSGGAGITIRYT